MSNDTTEPTGSEGSGTTRAVAPEVLVRALDEHAIVAVTDRRGRILEVNERFCAISGYSREQLLGQDHRILNSGRHPRRYMSDMWRTILRGKVWHGEFCNRARDGRLYWVQTSIVPMMDDQGRPERFVSIRTEFTAQKLAEASLAESESRFRRLFEQSGDALLLLDADSHHFIEANFAAARMLGFADATALRQISPAKLSPPTQEDGEPSADKAGRVQHDRDANVATNIKREALRRLVEGSGVSPATPRSGDVKRAERARALPAGHRRQDSRLRGNAN